MDPERAAALEQLRDIHLPAEPGWWPPAPGWWVVAFVLTGLVCFLLLLIYRKYRIRRPFRQFKTELMALSLQPETAESDLQTMSALARRLAITLYGREHVAALTGESWLALLDTLSGSRDFTDGPGRILEYGPYKPVATDPLQDQLHSLRHCLIALGRPARLPSRPAES